MGLTGPNLEGGVACDDEVNPLPASSDGSHREDNVEEDVEETTSGPRKKGYSYDEIPWAVIFSNPVSLTLFFNMFTYGWIGYMVLTELPSYLTDVLGEWCVTLMYQHVCVN